MLCCCTPTGIKVHTCYPSSKTSLPCYVQYCTVARTATQATKSTLRTLGVKVLPLLLTADLPAPAWVCPKRLFCPPPSAVPSACLSSFGSSKTHAPTAVLLCCTHLPEASHYVCSDLAQVAHGSRTHLGSAADSGEGRPHQTTPCPVSVILHVSLRNCLEQLALTLGGKTYSESPYQWRDLPISNSYFRRELSTTS